MHRNCLPYTVLKEREEERENEEEEDISSYYRNLREKILETEKENTRFPCVENSVWKRLWTCRKTDYIIITFLTP